MESASPAPENTLSLLTSAGSLPVISRDDGSSLSLICPVCEREYQALKRQWDWHRKSGTNRFLSCSKSCARRKWHLTNPGKSYFVGMPPEKRGKPTGCTRSPEVRQRISSKLKAIGHRPTVRGGNGTGMTPMELLVQLYLPVGWVWNYPVPLGRRQRGYPTNYKLDFADPQKKLGLEVDGGSHTSSLRRAQDRKKEAKLAELGWKVFRVSNADVALLYSTSKLEAHLTTMLGVAG